MHQVPNTGASIDLPVILEVEAQPRLSGICNKRPRMQQIPALCNRALGLSDDY
jgi:hypothetical protein